MAVASGATVAGVLQSTASAASVGQGPSIAKIRAIAFDAFAVFDPRPVFDAAEELVPGRGSELSNEWRTRQFEYTWLRALSGQYVDFWHVTLDALRFAMRKIGVALSDDDRDRLMNTYRSLKAWPDVAPALQSLHQTGRRLAFHSNFTPGMLDACIHSSGLDGLFERAISTHLARTYKPDPKSYQLAMSELELQHNEILFVAFAGWDAAGAKAFGYPTFWVNRLKQPREELGAAADAEGSSLMDVVRFLT